MENTESVTGERRISSKGEKTDKPSFEPFPAGDYELVLRGQKTEIRVSDENEDAVPYVSATFEALNTAKGENGKNRLVFHMFRLKNVPQKDGRLPWKSGNQLAGYRDSTGVEFDLPVTDFTTRAANTYEILSPEAVKEYLQGLDGQSVRARIKVKEASGAFQAKNEISYFSKSEEEQPF